MDENFGKGDRILSREDFVRVQRKGKRAASKHVFILWIPNGRGHSRLGITASRKFGKAVERNRFRRIVREVFRRNTCLFPTGCDIVVVPKKSQGGMTYNVLKREIEFLAESLSW